VEDEAVADADTSVSDAVTVVEVELPSVREVAALSVPLAVELAVVVVSEPLTVEVETAGISSLAVELVSVTVELRSALVTESLAVVLGEPVD
jgi:hypothetical protein